MAKETYYNLNHVRREVAYNHHDSEVVHHTAQDVEPVIELAQQMREEHQTFGGARVGANMVPIAEIPMIVYEQAVREGWADDPKAWRKWLNNPENKVFRITDGRA